MKILFSIDAPPDPNSGAAGTEWQTIQALRRLGHEVDEIWADDLPHRIKHGNLHYLIELPRGHRGAIAKKWETSAYDVIHVNQPNSYLAAYDHHRNKRSGVFVARSQGWESRVRSVLAPWRKKYNVPEWQLPRSIFGRLLILFLQRQEKLVTRYADGIIVSCSEDKDYLVGKFDLESSRVSNIPMAPPPFFLHKPCKPFTNDRLNNILYVSQFAFFKAPHVLAEVANVLLKDDLVDKFTWVCSANDHEKVRCLLTPEANNKTILLDWCEQEHLIEIYDDHGVFLFPSYTEGFGKVFLEAMSRGLCVVASNAGGAKDVINSGQNGYLVSVGSCSEMVSASRFLLNDYDNASVISTRAYETAGNYTWDSVANQTIEFYRHLGELKSHAAKQ